MLVFVYIVAVFDGKNLRFAENSIFGAVGSWETCHWNERFRVWTKNCIYLSCHRILNNNTIQILDGAGTFNIHERYRYGFCWDKNGSDGGCGGPYVCTSSAACIASHMFYAPQKALIVSFRVISTPPQLTEVLANTFRGTILAIFLGGPRKLLVWVYIRVTCIFIYTNACSTIR